MKEEFINLGLRKDNIARLETYNSIIQEYAAEGYKLTLRQLYYQLVSRAIIDNVKKEYAKLSTILVKGRMAGVVDWDAIEDRIRIPSRPYWVYDIADAIDDTIRQYRLDRMENQNVYIELWVEKDALSGVLKRITEHYGIYIMVNRGYSSCTAMHDAYVRFKRQANMGKETSILYLGDFDPSGLDMVRDIKGRLEEFGVYPNIQPIALTMEQIKEYNPPPNPAKVTDPRAKAYISQYGNTSWEVDALNPKILNNLVKEKIDDLIDSELFEEKLRQEEEDKKELEELKEDRGDN